MTKTGSGGTAWLELERPKPPRVADVYAFWGDSPPELSERCRYWLRQIERGWLPNRHISTMGRDATAVWFGVYLYEWCDVLYPAIAAREEAPAQPEG